MNDGCWLTFCFFVVWPWQDVRNAGSRRMARASVLRLVIVIVLLGVLLSFPVPPSYTNLLSLVSVLMSKPKPSQKHLAIMFSISSLLNVVGLRRDRA